MVTAAIKALPLVAASALAVLTGDYVGPNYPPIPQDLTTPFQQRLAVYGPNGKSHG